MEIATVLQIGEAMTKQKELAAPKNRAEENFNARMFILEMDLARANPRNPRKWVTEEVLGFIPTRNLTRLSQLYRERLIRAGFWTVQVMLEKWGTEELVDLFGAHRNLIPRVIESQLNEMGFKIEASYQLKRLPPR